MTSKKPEPQKHSFRADDVCSRCGLTRSDYVHLKAASGEEVPCPYKPTIAQGDPRVNR